tara:strand:+ start:403 stop:963 length:561 start_codon:yes stop_codon:yes gene_type:complete
VPSVASGQSQISLRYATALFDLAEGSKSLDTVGGNLCSIRTMIEGCDDLARLLHSPVLSREDQGKALAAVLGKAEIGDLTRRFVAVVASNHRLFALPAMIDTFFSLLAEKRGEIGAEVTSAKSLNNAQVKSLTNALKKAVGRNVNVTQFVDESIIGGLIIRVGSRMLDSSLCTKLHNLQLVMKGIG